MKKTIALFMAVLMALSIVPMAFAEEGNETAAEDPAEDIPDEAADGDEAVADELAVDEPEAEAETGAENETESEAEEEPEAEEEADVVEIPENVTEEAGTTPGSFTWGIDRALERISMKLTFGKSAKAKKGLAHAQERLMEVQAMIAQKRLGEAAEAQEAYDELMGEVQENVEAMGNGDELGDLEDVAEIEQAMAENEAIVAQTSRLKTKFKGLTAEQSAAITSIVGSLGNSTSVTGVQVMAKKNKTKIKLKAKEGLTDEQVSQVVSQINEAVASGREAKVVLPGKGKSKIGRAHV